MGKCYIIYYHIFVGLKQATPNRKKSQPIELCEVVYDSDLQDPQFSRLLHGSFECILFSIYK